VSGEIILRATGGSVVTAVIVAPGERAVKRAVEFFNATIRNRYLARVGQAYRVRSDRRALTNTQAQRPGPLRATLRTQEPPAAGRVRCRARSGVSHPARDNGRSSEWPLFP
jgi:hypothetical protein